VTLNELLSQLSRDVWQVSLPRFLPELILCGTICVMLLTRVFGLRRIAPAFGIAFVGSLLGLVAALVDLGQSQLGEVQAEQIFLSMLIFDSFTVYFRAVLLFFATLFCLLTLITGIPDRDDGPDVYSLVLGATLGMCLMASANHLLMVFLAVEMASVPSYVLAGVMKGRPQASEAALKYSVYGAGAAGVMLYGISLVAGLLGTAHLPTIAVRLAAMDIPEMISAGAGMSELSVLMLGGLMITVGVAFKLSAVPFHFWCPDVFAGATAEVNAFLSVASKAAALALLVRVAIGFAGPAENALPVPAQDAQAQVSRDAQQPGENPAALQQAQHAKDRHAKDRLADQDSPVRPAAIGAVDGQAEQELSPLAPVRIFIAWLLALLAAITCTFGNLAAFGQTNIKRLLAYSTIAHAGYMIMPVAAAIATVEHNPQLAREAIGALTFYIALYLFMNLGAFAIVAFLRNAMRSEEIEDYAGLIGQSPGVVVCFALILVSLLGLPPLAGFAGKYAIFLSLVRANTPITMALLLIGGLNTAISLIYYLRVVKVMTMDPAPADRLPVEVGWPAWLFTFLVTVPVVVLGVFFEEAYRLAYTATQNLFS